NDLVNVLSGIDMPVILLGNKLRIRRFNDAAAKMLNLVATETGRPLSDIRTTVIIPDLEQMARDVIDTLDVKELDVRDGSGRWYSVRIRPYKTADNRIDGVLVVMVDITERKQTEGALQASSDRYRSYIELTGELGWTTNAAGEVVEDLPSWRMYTGQSFEEVRGQGWSEALHPDDVAHALQVWRKAVSLKSRYEVEYRVRRHDGIYRHFMVRGIPVLQKDGTIREWVGTCIDITDRKKADKEIRRLNAKLERKVRELEASNKDWEMFSHAVSHELRSPLFLIDGFSHLLLKNYADKVDVKGRDQLTTVRDAAKHMKQLLEDLFVFCRASATGIKADMVDTEETVKHAFEELRRDIENRNIRLEVKPLPPCHADRSLLRQVFVNLFANAVKFTKPREIALIEVGGTERGGDVEFYVKDNGVGFDMEHKDKLFNIFQRLHGSDSFDGTGAGLAIVRRIIEKHGGRVWAESKVGEGATFYFTLPAHKCI
ncbi:MAG: sensor histidine kinase, partial [Chloroflexota bacterium]